MISTVVSILLVTASIVQGQYDYYFDEGIALFPPFPKVPVGILRRDGDSTLAKSFGGAKIGFYQRSGGIPAGPAETFIFRPSPDAKPVPPGSKVEYVQPKPVAVYSVPKRRPPVVVRPDSYRPTPKPPTPRTPAPRPPTPRPYVTRGPRPPIRYPPRPVIRPIPQILPVVDSLLPVSPVVMRPRLPLGDFPFIPAASAPRIIPIALPGIPVPPAIPRVPLQPEEFPFLPAATAPRIVPILDQ